MKFNELARSILEDNIQTPLRVPQVGKERYPEEMEDNIVSQEEENDFDREEDNEKLEYEFFEILGKMKIDQPEVFDMFISRLEDKGFRDQLKNIAGTYL